MGPSEAVVLGLLLGALGTAECGSHSLRYFMTGMTDPGPGMPRFVIVGYVDGKIFGIYDSKSRTAQPIAEMLPQEDQEHWATQTQKARGGERDFDWFLGRLPECYNISGGSHTLQRIIGCDILEDGSIRGYDQYAFDGKDYIAFDMDTMTFTAADPVAEITKRRWETEGTYAERWKHELGTVCVQNLRRYLEHGKAALKRTEPQPNLIPIVAGAVVAIVAVIAVVVGLVVWKSKSGKEKKGYEAAPGHDGESSISATGSEPSI
ncbi:class I histocompatibility antigen, F10 alpha chain isoform X4 [Gallus gallus]|uniref:class I histocompatibility antigen, F10 alpha chain isoform X4 n=1 Tax=Gallus gallus TaxID=9031 RepID=UPI001AE319E8|nr:class I histocompatibility antigen, F10 alpha chain isoform X4 [Gallus gallus]